MTIEFGKRANSRKYHECTKFNSHAMFNKHTLKLLDNNSIVVIDNITHKEALFYSNGQYFNEIVSEFSKPLNMIVNGMINLANDSIYLAKKRSDIKWQEFHEGKNYFDLTPEEQKQGDMRFVCEGCSTIVKSECDLEYVQDESNCVEYQYCPDCADMYQ